MLFIRFYLDQSARLYLCKVMKMKNKSANTQLADDYFPVVVPPIC